MKLPRRRFLHLALGAATLPAVSRVARAQTYPARPVRIIVGFPAGGSADIVARLAAQWLSERFGRQFIVENRPGAGNNIGTEAVVRASADGYTLLLVSLVNAINATLYDRLNFDFIRDIVPISGIARSSGVVVVHPSVAAKTIPELIAYAKANPGKLNMATAGIGSYGHVFGEMFKAMASVDLVPVHYRGDTPAMTDLLGGQVQVYFGSLSASIGHIRDGRLRALAVTVATRLEVLPGIPTVGEFVPGYEASGWTGIGAPKNTPTELSAKLNTEINAALADAEFRARLADLGSTPLAMTPAAFSKFIAEETEKWGRLMRAANIKAE